jgi:hypothetical protein
VVAGAADAGVFVSVDAGANWTLATGPINPTPSKPHVPRPWFAYFDHEPIDVVNIYIGTQGRGVWRISFKLPWNFEYAAKLVCGLQKDPKDMRLARGFYATTINIHNPNDVNAVFFKKLALTFPPEEQKAGSIIRIAIDTLKPDEALKVDCNEVQKLFPNGFPQPYVEGFVVVQSLQSLDVTAVYSTAALDKEGMVTAHSSIDVDQIRERVIKRGNLPDLIVKDIDTIRVNCPPVGGPCVTTVRYTITNIGTGNAGAFNIRVVCDPGQSVVVNQSVAGLAAGAVMSFTVTTPPGGNCFDPDCTVCVAVDSNNTVEESNEGNNQLCKTRIGQ